MSHVPGGSAGSDGSDGIGRSAPWDAFAQVRYGTMNEAKPVATPAAAAQRTGSHGHRQVAKYANHGAAIMNRTTPIIDSVSVIAGSTRWLVASRNTSPMNVSMIQTRDASSRRIWSQATTVAGSTRE